MARLSILQRARAVGMIEAGQNNTQIFSAETDSSSDFESLPEIKFEPQRRQTQNTHGDIAQATPMNPNPNSQQYSEFIAPSTLMNVASSPSTSGPSASFLTIPEPSSFIDAGTPTVSLRQSPSRHCLICFDREPNAFFFPCGHTACTVCAVFIQENTKKCPTCRNQIFEVKTIFTE